MSVRGREGETGIPHTSDPGKMLPRLLRDAFGLGLAASSILSPLSLFVCRTELLTCNLMSHGYRTVSC